jgi:hypothetical protein
MCNAGQGRVFAFNNNGGRWFKDNFSKWITSNKTDGSMQQAGDTETRGPGEPRVESKTVAGHDPQVLPTSSPEKASRSPLAF